MLTQEEVKRVAALARISLTESELERFGKDLSSILDYVKTLDRANTEGIEPLYQTSGIVTAIREDESFELINQKEKGSLLIDQAPNKDSSMIKVKSIITK